MSWSLGDAFKKDNHLYFIVAVDCNRRVAVSLATIRNDVRVDESCALFPGEHPFINRPTYVVYSRALKCTIEDLDNLLHDGKITLFTPPASRELVFKILDKSKNSRDLMAKTRELMDKQFLELI